MTIFHLAIPVHDLSSARRFYGELLGCKTGRETSEWIDFDFFGHQLSVHQKPAECAAVKTNEVDGKNVPVRHFGIILPWKEWQQLAARLHGRVSFLIEPHIRFKGETGEQATMFFTDTSGNALEFKSFQDMSQILHLMR